MPAADVTPSVMVLKCLLNKLSTDHGVKTYKSTLQEAVNKRIGGILSEPLYSIATMLDARYKDRYFDADKKQGLREMLHTQLDKSRSKRLLNSFYPHSDSVLRGRETTDS